VQLKRSQWNRTTRSSLLRIYLPRPPLTYSIPEHTTTYASAKTQSNSPPSLRQPQRAHAAAPTGKLPAHILHPRQELAAIAVPEPAKANPAAAAAAAAVVVVGSEGSIDYPAFDGIAAAEHAGDAETVVVAGAGFGIAEVGLAVAAVQKAVVGGTARDYSAAAAVARIGLVARRNRKYSPYQRMDSLTLVDSKIVMYVKARIARNAASRFAVMSVYVLAVAAAVVLLQAERKAGVEGRVVVGRQVVAVVLLHEALRAVAAEDMLAADAATVG